MQKEIARAEQDEGCVAECEVSRRANGIGSAMS